jgi:hypothetical protein
MVVNKFVVWGVVITAVITFLIFRKKIFKSLPAVEKLKDQIMKGDGMGDTTAADAMTKFIPNTSGAVINEMLRDTLSKYSITGLEESTRDWNSVKATSEPGMFDNVYGMKSKPVTVNDLYPKHVQENIAAIEDMGQLIRNQVVINDLFGRPGCGCHQCSGKALSFN